MTNTLASPRVDAVIERMFDAAARDSELGQPALPPGRASWSEVSPAERSAAYASHYIPVSAEAGKLLYALVRSIRPETVVEFGTSFGLSTLYLAAGVTDNGAGHVTTTELSESKVEAARANLDEAGLGAAVTILSGDALETLRDLQGPIGLVLLDGWKELCLPVLRLLEPKLTPGAIVAADDVSFPSMAQYLDYVRDASNGYVSVEFPVEDGMELSCWTATAAD